VTIHDKGLQGHILRTGESSLIPVVTDEMLEAAMTDKEHLEIVKKLRLRSSISVPMKIQNKIIGTIGFVSTIEGRQYDQIDLDFAKDFATRIALTLENARLHEESQREINQRIIAENKKDEFIGVASHELKTPMTTINASIQMLDRIYRKEPDSDAIPKLLETTKKSAAKLSGLIGELLNVTRIEAGQLKLNPHCFRLSQTINECCEHVRLLGTHKLSIEGDLDLEVIADSQRINQVVLNFINNAVKYAPDENDIKILIEKLPGKARLSVIDKGIGISEEKLPFIFDRYYRVDNSGIQFSGLGLGLYISSEIIKMHGGEIGAASKLGFGSTFWFTIPLD
jgi:signal transduction histidine kinase